MQASCCWTRHFVKGVVAGLVMRMAFSSKCRIKSTWKRLDPMADCADRYRRARWRTPRVTNTGRPVSAPSMTMFVSVMKLAACRRAGGEHDAAGDLGRSCGRSRRSCIHSPFGPPTVISAIEAASVYFELLMLLTRICHPGAAELQILGCRLRALNLTDGASATTL